MTTKTRKANKPKTTGASTTQPQTTPPSELPLAWEAKEQQTRHRWWWYLAIGYLGLPLALITGSAGEWATMSVTIAGTLALIIIFAQKPRSYIYLLTTGAITIDDKKNHAKDHEFTQHNYFTIDITDATKSQPEQYTIALIPKRRFAPALEIYLPENPTQALSIVETFQTVLTYNDAPGYNTTQRTLRSIGRVLHL